MIEKILLIVVGLSLIGLIISLALKRRNKARPQPKPRPTSEEPVYEHYLHSVETVIRNNLSEEKLLIYLESQRSEIEKYSKEQGFAEAFKKLFEKYNVPWGDIRYLVTHR